MNKIIQTHFDSTIQIMAEYEEKRKLQIEVDGVINDLYRILEFVKLDAVNIGKVTKKLRENLQLRRRIKEELILMMAITDTTTGKLNPGELLQRQKVRISKYIAESNESFKRILPD